VNAALSIVVPVLDEAAAQPAALAHLGALRAAGAEIVVVDGGSRDGSAERWRAVADVLLLDAPRGRARQMNAGAAATHGTALLFLHADTRLPDGALERVAQALQQRAWGRFDVTIDGRTRRLRLVAALMNARSRATGIATGDQAMFVRRDAFDAVGGFPDQPLMEDIELSRRLKRTAGAPACLRERVVTSGRRWERHGVWRTVALMWRLRLLYWLGVPAERLARSYR
jgi:rSAM/selenodomain-associated transferase 2